MSKVKYLYLWCYLTKGKGNELSISLFKFLEISWLFGNLRPGN